MTGIVPCVLEVDACLGQIGVDAVRARMPFDCDRLSARGMHDAEHHHHREALLPPGGYLDASSVPYDRMRPP